ncbi:hypothetical protein [Azospirillum brasilense]|uniref:hypothetical protein n=1 Tax=Azospirillum brasilense TaxID=192 RepID=UPI000E69C16D|nr:hypothetical protein [Azospirillum brasilense]NUB26597.1 hypothetical protein [Azospirillum brasilense]NUB34306.1 hypothetical protein [Azospirillum brasilense]RIW08166.1 hypothetical protein D2T81_00160 [Azospirillum brasilense]
MAPVAAGQPTRFAIQKARGKGWKTLEVGEDLDHARARFNLMVRVNPRAYFRLIQLDHNAGAGGDGIEFNWKLVELHDPNQGGAAGAGRQAVPARAAPRSAPRSARARTVAKGPRRREKVPLPLKFYAAVVLAGLLIGGALYLRYGLPGP